ncbi:hypothetical protein OESDEN_11465 [Oesophagostomum dentatum]|uniref:Uncharacterized protein n=1 Tax=Oesophagostomum dentatum TaxID=61180 RepID=A0A0B1SUW4_OESDE|nr:hypothetical protein OESDEN_11465 [Oesophagostomum dentatum]
MRSSVSVRKRKLLLISASASPNAPVLKNLQDIVQTPEPTELAATTSKAEVTTGESGGFLSTLTETVGRIADRVVNAIKGVFGKNVTTTPAPIQKRESEESDEQHSERNLKKEHGDTSNTDLEVLKPAKELPFLELNAAEKNDVKKSTEQTKIRDIRVPDKYPEQEKSWVPEKRSRRIKRLHRRGRRGREGREWGDSIRPLTSKEDAVNSPVSN